VTLITIVVVALAVLGSLAYNRRVWRPGQAKDASRADGLTTTEVAVPLVTLAVVLTVFVLVQVFSSWTSAGRAESSEATGTLLLFRETDLLDGPSVRRAVRGDIVCYATSVIEQDWPAMGDRQISNVPTYWAALVRRAGVREARLPGRQEVGQAFVKRDGERAAARQERLGEARPSVPGALNVLMLIAVVGTLVILGTASASVMRPGVHVAIVVVSAVVFGGTLLLIRDFDQPYTGLTGRAPTQTELVRDLIVADVPVPLPCDSNGLPRDDPSFRASRRALR
jgi:hypothetical protein